MIYAVVWCPISFTWEFGDEEGHFKLQSFHSGCPKEGLSNTAFSLFVLYNCKLSVLRSAVFP